MALEHERLELPDGDFLDLAHTAATSTTDGSAGTPRVLIFHGLAGCSRSAYVRGLMGALQQRGWQATLMHWRGCSGEPNRLPRSYHSGETEDIGTLVDEMQAREPDRPLFAVGYSLGGNALLKYLGERGAATALRGAVSVCPPLQLEVGADTLDQGFAKLYQRYLIGLLCDQLETKQRRYPHLALPPAPPRHSNFWVFDDRVTAPLHGFSDVHEYYRVCSARAWLPGIERPTRIIYALDDPFFSADVLPEPDSLPQCVELELSGHGGHVGFVSGVAPWRLRFWLDAQVVDCLQRQYDRPATRSTNRGDRS